MLTQSRFCRPGQILALLVSLSVLTACSSGGKFDKTYELQGGASESIALTGDKPQKVGWELVDKQSGMNCPESKCVNLERSDDMGYIGGQFGAAMEFQPKDGKMNFKLKNLAPFALKVRVYTE